MFDYRCQLRETLKENADVSCSSKITKLLDGTIGSSIEICHNYRRVYDCIVKS